MNYLNSRGYEILKSRKQIFSNFEKDEALNKNKGGKTLRELFYDFIGGFTGDEELFTDFCDKGFLFKNKLLGSVFEGKLKNLLLGHSQTKMKFREILSAGNPNYIGEEIESMLDERLIYTKDSREKRFELKLLKSIFDQTPFGYFITWSYVNNDFVKDFLEGENLEELPYVLGLKGPNLPRYIMAHVLRNKKPFIPTAIDAGVDDENWRPGGKTIPLAGCKEKEGKTEVVHKPNVFNEIVEFKDNFEINK